VPKLPVPRGPLSAALLRALAGSAPPADDPTPLFDVPVPARADPFADEDLQLALYVAYELHYRGFDGVDEAWEWSPALLAVRARMERVFEDGLHAAVPPDEAPAAEDVDLAIRAIADAESPDLSRYLERRASLDQYREVLAQRSAYQLKEADPHSWAMPRLYGRPKAALVEIQADEYGGGRPERMHAQLFADAMAGLGMDPQYGAYLDRIPATALATVNLMSFFGLHRRWRGAIVGHLALFESTSSIPNARYAAGLRRLGRDDEAVVGFFDEHVEADAVHENLATVDMAGGLIRQDPSLGPDVLFGARCLSLLEGRWATGVLAAWERGETSLLRPLDREAVPA
jgi:hypothetical protein